MADLQCVQCGLLKSDLSIVKEREHRFEEALREICEPGVDAATVAKRALGFDPTLEKSIRMC
jgi:hypothetical protein